MLTCRPCFRRRDGRSIKARSVSYSYTPLQVAQAYGIPSNLDGSGQTIGIIELGGAFSQSDLNSYLTGMGLPSVPVTVVAVAGGSMQSDPGGADVEVMLDICVPAPLAPKAAYRFYFAPNTDTGFVAAVARAANECDVISISWGAPESQWSAVARTSMDAALQAAASKGVSVFVAAGDNGSDDGTGSPVTDYPASSPWAIGCGGTYLAVSNGVVIQETVWNDGSQGGATGGGFSTYYAKPSYQGSSVPGTRRGVPDVAGPADPESGWIIRANGQMQTVGGTSAVAPFWAAVAALLGQKAGKRAGWLTSLYSHPEAFNDTISGNNGAYQAGPNWDPCTGMGSPKGGPLFALFGGVTPPPTPTPTPTPTPVPGGPSDLEQAVQQVVDDLFDQVIAQYRGRPLIVRVLKMLKAAVDVEIQKVFASGSHSSVILDQLVDALVRAGFGWLETRLNGYPWLVSALEEIRPVIEQAILGMLHNGQAVS